MVGMVVEALVVIEGEGARAALPRSAEGMVAGGKDIL